MSILIIIIAVVALCFLWNKINNHHHQKKLSTLKALVLNYIQDRKKEMPLKRLHDVERIALCELLKTAITSKNKNGYDNLRLVIMIEFPQHVESVMAYQVNLSMGHLGYSDEDIIETHRDFKELFPNNTW